MAAKLHLKILSFRNYQVAAPLKLGFRAGRPCTGPRLPQLSSCGPIEAWDPAEPKAWTVSFRNYQVAAPLKPVLDGRGRIEGRAFRNYQVAAPLKRRFGRACINTTKPSATIKLRPH